MIEGRCIWIMCLCLPSLCFYKRGSGVGAFSPPARLRLHVQSSLLLYAPWGFPALIEINTVDSPDGLAHIGLVYGNTWKVK